MNSHERESQQTILLFKDDIKIKNFKELRKAMEFRLVPSSQEGILRNMDVLSSSPPSVECLVFPHGYEDDDENHVSICFRLHLGRVFTRVHWSAIISLVNADGNPKFLTSVGTEETFTNDSGQGFGVVIPVTSLTCPRFVERRLLLDDEEENLPGGVLTIKCEMEIRYDLDQSETLRWALLKGHLRYKTHQEHGYSCGLNFNSSLCNSLCEESTYFQDVPDRFMSKDKWHYVSDNLGAFADMLYFIESKNLDHVTESASLIRLYGLADKYKVEKLINQCRNLLIGTLSPNIAATAFIQAYNCFDIQLKDACSKYIDSLSADELLFVKKELKAKGGERFGAYLFGD